MLADRVGFAFFITILVAYIIIFIGQYLRHVPGTERLLVLNSRTAMFLPLYAFFMLISLEQPRLLAAMTVPTSMVEGYTFYCFFSLIVTNLNGPVNAVAAFKDSGKELYCCNPCCHKDHLKFYQRAVWGVFHLVVTRVLVITLAAGCFYSNTAIGKLLYAGFNVIGTIILSYCLTLLVLFYENVYNDNVNIYGIVKFSLLKFTVTLIVFQGLISEFMIAAKSEPFNDDDTWSAQQKTERGYCMLVLLEFIILTLPYLYTFLYRIEKSKRILTSSSKLLEEDSSPMSFLSYFGQILCFWDVFGTLTYRDEDDLNEPLNSHLI